MYRLVLLFCLSLTLLACGQLPVVKSDTRILGYKASTTYVEVEKPIEILQKNLFGVRYPVIFPAGKYVLHENYEKHPDGSSGYYYESVQGVRYKSTLYGFMKTQGRFLLHVSGNKLVYIEGVFNDSGGGQSVVIPKESYRYIKLRGAK